MLASKPSSAADEVEDVVAAFSSTMEDKPPSLVGFMPTKTAGTPSLEDKQASPSKEEDQHPLTARAKSVSSSSAGLCALMQQQLLLETLQKGCRLS